MIGTLFIDAAGAVVVLFFLALNTLTAVLLMRALPELWRHWDPADEAALAPELRSAALPTVSIIVTGVAAPSTIVARVHQLLTLEFPRHEVVLVHDDRSGGALDALTREFDLYHVPPAVLVNVPTGPVRAYFRSRRHGKLFVLDKAHTDAADDLNAALNASRFPYILTMDVGISLRSDALLRLMRPFLLGQRVAAVSATARIAEPRTLRAGARAVEVLRDLVYVGLGWNDLGGHPAVHDGLLLHRRDYLLELDGYRSGAADPELDLLVRLREHLRARQLSDAIPSIPDAVGAVSLEGGWGRGRRRIAERGRVETLREHRASLFDGRQGAWRLLAPLHQLITTVVAPVMELVAYLVLALALIISGPGEPVVAMILLAVPGYSLLLSWWAIALEKASGADSTMQRTFRLVAYSVVEQLGYRQAIVWHRLRAAWLVLRGGHSGGQARLATGDELDATLRSAEQARLR
jgi:cellulose synthase/poly-beta-1,6-N-acetylglucosamine synthase-like glycosyltransferase